MQSHEFLELSKDVATAVLSDLRDVIKSNKEADIKFVLDVIEETLSQVEEL